MKLNSFVTKMDEAGDAYIYYMSPVSKKLKYHIGTIHLDNCDYIRNKSNTKTSSAAVKEGQVRVFCWDLDDFKNIELSYITKIVPLNDVLNGRND